MITILKQRNYKEMIPAALPDSVHGAHKTGLFTGVNHDSGLVILPADVNIYSYCSKNMEYHKQFIQLFAYISEDIYEFKAKATGRWFQKFA